MTNVLLPVDGSPSATRAVAWLARTLRGRADAHVHLLHVQPAVDAWEVRSHLDAGDVARFESAAHQAVLEPAAATLREAGIGLDTHAVSGEVAPQVHALVQQLGCDSVVMGTRGLGTVQALLLGSTAMQVLHLVDVPVTLIK
jgi:nucleotide-binding universal stress UspA family protein